MEVDVLWQMIWMILAEFDMSHEEMPLFPITGCRPTV
jgi:hypothetical protein